LLAQNQKNSIKDFDHFGNVTNTSVSVNGESNHWEIFSILLIFNVRQQKTMSNQDDQNRNKNQNNQNRGPPNDNMNRQAGGDNTQTEAGQNNQNRNNQKNKWDSDKGQ
jgi:hypothetical protein